MSELEKRARETAQKLFELMETWDKFDTVLHRLDYLLALIDKEDVKYISEYYDFGELLSSTQHYIELLKTIKERLAELLGE